MRFERKQRYFSTEFLGGAGMAISAFVFVECTAGHAIQVARGVREIPGVIYAHAATGPYDVIALIEAPDLNVMGEVVIKQIQGIEGVIRTQTNVVVE
jgi:DNA-binding Lrp family transcriptional regulator